MTYFEKQHSSRIMRVQNLAYAANQTSVLASTKFTAQTYQIRVVSQITGYFTVGDSSSITATTSADLIVLANTDAEYFAVTPGQWCAFNSTSTSTGYCSVTEM